MRIMLGDRKGGLLEIYWRGGDVDYGVISKVLVEVPLELSF